MEIEKLKKPKEEIEGLNSNTSLKKINEIRVQVYELVEKIDSDLTSLLVECASRKTNCTEEESLGRYIILFTEVLGSSYTSKKFTKKRIDINLERLLDLLQTIIELLISIEEEKFIEKIKEKLSIQDNKD